MFVPKDPHPKRFCGTSCSAKWRCTTYPRTLTPDQRKKLTAARIAWYYGGSPEAEAAKKRISELSSKKTPESIAKQKATMKRKGYKVKFRGGNGQPLPLAQKSLLDILGADWKPEFVVRTLEKRGSGFPYHYKIDIANQEMLIAIEVDGGSHASTLGRQRDAKKNLKLNSLGWTVLRFSNKEILAWINSGMQKDGSISTTLRQHGIRLTQ
jgi:hypothetical protein